MIEIKGKYNKAVIYTDRLDDDATSQIYNMLNNPAFCNTEIAIMPDVHIGKGSVVGFTMKGNGYFIPNVIGVDIGCGMDAYNLGYIDPDFGKLDAFIKQRIPAGRKVHDAPQKRYFSIPKAYEELSLRTGMDYNRMSCSIGSLGGGNHFIELDRDDTGNLWLVIHTGSRGLGVKVCDFHQMKAREHVISEFSGANAYHRMEYLPLSNGGDAYLADMKITQEYASLNREVIARIIVKEFFGIFPEDLERITSVHNYYNFNDQTIRKGAISAHVGERVIIPLNMRDGSIIATGKGNNSWNNSAPHGAGRLLGRGDARKLIDMDEYRRSMEGIYTSCISSDTVDESPMAYKPADEIIKRIGDTVSIDFIMKPVYNFKAGEE